MSGAGAEGGEHAELLRLPSEPYPGLRPFLSHEAMLLLGRERQVREVIDRLQQTQFVAVIGGSGSGKSSLVLAGVVPELRSFGIPGAGDFWLPMVCTPGTNATRASPATGDAGAAPSNTPITRLAWKFAKLLRPAGSPDAEATRLADIAAVFRQEAGFARLIDTYADELLERPGPAAKDLRLLFVVDQFEELFHPTNKDVDDAHLLVERVIDHFFNPHPRCFVVLTMRSEHLNDCAGYLELPDAINKSSYLVRRLDEQELREAIVGPAQRYLRLLQRIGRPGGPPLPDAVDFEARVVDRLLLDVSAITHDPDHLPLLQHLLARLWEAACAREAVVQGVPAHIDWADLVCAVMALPAAAPGDAGRTVPASIGDNVNVLRASLENWAEAVYQRHHASQRERLDSVLRRLAFKDPNTGMYTQQRIDVDDPALFPGEPNPRRTLRALIDDGFVGSVDYLFWDDENPLRVTLKVSHESFIRGWSRFRRWADEEDRQFQAYLRLLDDAGRWVDSERNDDALSGGETLRAYQAASLDDALRNPDRSARFERLLQIDRDGKRLAPMASQALEFLSRSLRKRDQRAAAREEEQREQQAVKEAADRAEREAIVARSQVTVEREKIRRVKLWRWGLALGLLGFVGFSTSEWMLAKRERTLHRGYALAAETQVSQLPQMSGFDAGQVQLRHALLGAYFFQSGSQLATGPAIVPPLRWFYGTRIDGLQSTELLGEVRSIASLRSVLRGAVWPVRPEAASAPTWLKQPPPRICGTVFRGDDDQTASFEGAQFYAGPSAADGRGLVVTAPGVQGTAFFVGRMKDRRCEIDNQLSSAPAEALQVGTAADLSSLVFEFDRYFQIYAVVWGDANGVQARPRVVIQKLGSETMGDAGEPGVKTLPSAYSAFATDIKLAGRTLRVFDMESTPVATATALQGEPLLKAGAQGVCAAFAAAQAIEMTQEDVWSVHRKDGGRTYCLHVKRARGDAASPGGLPFLASLYGFENEAQAGDRTKHLPLFSEEVMGAARPTGLRIDVGNEWLAFEGANREWRALPWGLHAWRALANGVVEAPGASTEVADDQPFRLLLSGTPVTLEDLRQQFSVAQQLPTKIGTSMAAEPTPNERAAMRSVRARFPGRTPPASSPPRR